MPHFQQRTLDPLTGLPDRTSGYKLLESLLDDPDIPHVAALWLDIDRFHQINQSIGHALADEVLREIARRIVSITGDCARCFRMEGDEFLLIAPGLSPLDVESLAYRLINGVDRPIAVGTLCLRPSISIGIATSLENESAGDLAMRADLAKRECKAMGGWCYRHSNDTVTPARKNKDQARRDILIEDYLKRALQEHGLHLVYQPIISADGNAVVLFESLMRCRVDDHEISPVEFIPIAERTGLIKRIGEFGLITAAEFVSELHRQGAPIRVAVNISRVQLADPGFGQFLHNLFVATSCPRGAIELEITESVFLDRSDVVQSNIRAAIQAGFTLSLDDFGTGYSSLSCLKDLPVEKIKLDRAFVVDIPRDSRSVSIARVLCDLANDFEMTIVAEGVETESQCQSLIDSGVHAIQGYLFSKPIPQPSVLNWIQDHDYRL